MKYCLEKLFGDFKSSLKKEGLGFWIYVLTLVLYFLLSLPITLSVKCGNVNEGFYFVNGELLLQGKKLYTDIFIARGPIFFLFYALVIKLFGFGTGAIIAVHFAHRFTVIAIGTLIYLITKRLLLSELYAGLAVLFWILIEITPIGGWGYFAELETAFALEAEYFCILFSLVSIYLLVLALEAKVYKSLFFISGLFAICSVMTKANGSILFIAYICWLMFLVLFKRDCIRKEFLFLYLGLIIGIFLSLFFIYVHTSDLMRFWEIFFLLGNYNEARYLRFTESFFSSLFTFMFRDKNSISNFLLILFAFFSFVWCLVRVFFFEQGVSGKNLVYPLIGIWGIGSAVAVIAPGGYGSYYYVIIWAPVIVSLIILFRDLFNGLNKVFNCILKAAILLFIVYRLIVIFPVYLQLTKVNIDLNLFFQAESFQDPVRSWEARSIHPKRYGILSLADLINKNLPDKTDRFYAFNFIKDDSTLCPFVYIYAKRGCASSVVSDWLHVPSCLSKALPLLKKDLVNNSPKIIVIPRTLDINLEQAINLDEFFLWVRVFLKEKYHLKNTVTIYYKTRGGENVIKPIDFYELN